MPAAELLGAIEYAANVLNIEVPSQDHERAILAVVSKLQPYTAEDFASWRFWWEVRTPLNFPSFQSLGFDRAQVYSTIKVWGAMVDKDKPYLFSLIKTQPDKPLQSWEESFVAFEEVNLAEWSLSQRGLDFQGSGKYREWQCAPHGHIIGETLLKQGSAVRTPASTS